MACKTEFGQQRGDAWLGLRPKPGRPEVQRLAGDLALPAEYAPAQAITCLDELHAQASRRQHSGQRQAAQPRTDDGHIGDPSH